MNLDNVLDDIIHLRGSIIEREDGLYSLTSFGTTTPTDTSGTNLNSYYVSYDSTSEDWVPIVLLGSWTYASGGNPGYAYVNDKWYYVPQGDT